MNPVWHTHTHTHTLSLSPWQWVRVAHPQTAWLTVWGMPCHGTDGAPQTIEPHAFYWALYTKACAKRVPYDCNFWVLWMPYFFLFSLFICSHVLRISHLCQGNKKCGRDHSEPACSPQRMSSGEVGEMMQPKPRKRSGVCSSGRAEIILQPGTIMVAHIQTQGACFGCHAVLEDQKQKKKKKKLKNNNNPRTAWEQIITQQSKRVITAQSMSHYLTPTPIVTQSPTFLVITGVMTS